jgi:hypothetical protein
MAGVRVEFDVQGSVTPVSYVSTHEVIVCSKTGPAASSDGTRRSGSTIRHQGQDE